MFFFNVYELVPADGPTLEDLLGNPGLMLTVRDRQVLVTLDIIIDIDVDIDREIDKRDKGIGRYIFKDL